jgi:hypothetical protein
MRSTTESIETELGTYNKRHLQALIRRRMMSKTVKSKKNYSRKTKHKMSYE